MTTEIVLFVEEAPESGFMARDIGQAIFVEAGTLPELHAHLRNAVACHFEPDVAPKLIRLHFVRDKVIAA